MKIVLCGGGTGGHINPAIAIADEIKKIVPDVDISFIGTEKGMENRLVPRAGYSLDHVKVMGFRRSLSPKNIIAAYRAVSSVSEAKKILKRILPDLVIGTGGYVSWPAVKAAAKLGIPTLIHEQNAFPGVTTRKLSGYADRICISFESSRKFFDDSVQNKIVITGNPIHADEYDRAELRKKYGIKDGQISVLSFGGSLGAQQVNKNVIEAMHLYTADAGIKHTHATGKGGYDEVMLKAREYGLDKYDNIEIVDYIYDMPMREVAADIIICRAGAITLAELAYRRKAAVFIPSPNVTDDHQYKNAAVLAEAGAGIVIKESELTGKILADTVKRLAENKQERTAMENAAAQFAKPNAAKEIAAYALELVKNGN